MKWVLILYMSGKAFATPLPMSTKEACIAGAKNVDENTVSVWTLCLNVETGEVVSP